MTSQLNTYKHGKKMSNDFEDHKIEFELNSARNYDNRDNDFENKSQIIDTKCNTYQRYKKINNINTSREIDLGTTTKKVGDVIITTKTTQISYKRKRGGNNQNNQ